MDRVFMKKILFQGPFGTRLLEWITTISSSQMHDHNEDYGHKRVQATFML